MKVLQFQSVGGASGDMILAALLDLGVEPAWLRKQLAVLPLEPFRLIARSFGSHGLHGTQVEVATGGHIKAEGRRLKAEGGGSEAENRRLQAEGARHHHGRSFQDIRRLIEGSRLPEPVRAQSVRVFRRLAEVEAGIHHVAVKAVHFHEIGAVDSIVDIVGACLALHRMGVEQVVVNSLPTGAGVVTCAHGVYPVPAPATVELLRGFPLQPCDEPHEMVTPTGAALLMEWKSLARLPAGSRIMQAGHGFGHRQLDRRPNLLRALLLETAEAGDAATEEGLLLECNLDDTSPELIGLLTQRLLAAGALDVWTTAIQMKKQRPGVLLSTLCRVAQRAELLDLIFRESTTFGVRETPVRRTVLARRVEERATPYGPVRIKVGIWQGAEVTCAPEIDDCAARAAEHKVAVRAVYEAACRAATFGQAKPGKNRNSVSSGRGKRKTSGGAERKAGSAVSKNLSHG
ncbi:MAG: nickel pincer cofactor biosynthesis protein LarC [Kiritimatiellaeota bacterium]|nr:nickel pincer cofactor biosynthesis protein LarC [Kiritimatiellota bacterium]